MKKHQIRIVGGLYKRTLITVIDSEHLRPTSDRIRETLFNWLNHFWSNQFADKQVLDLFAGSGALGIEAASRGVARVKMIDNSRAAIGQINNVIKKLGATNIETEKTDAISFLKNHKRPSFDLILLDPPFGQDWCKLVIPLLSKVLYSGGLIYLEAEHSFEIPKTPELQILRQESTKNVNYSLIRFAASQKNSNNDNKF